MSDEEGDGATEWDDGECIPLEEELTDLDTDDDDNSDLPMSEQDVEDSASIDYDFSATSKHRQPLKTCVQQQELTPHHHHHHHHQRFSEAFLQVNGAGLIVPDREMTEHGHHGAASYSGNTGGGADAAENGLDLIAEVERRRRRDFGPLDHQIEGSCSIPSKGEGSHGANIIIQEERNKSVPASATKERPYNEKVGLDQKSTKRGAPAVKTCGETSASDPGVGNSLGVSTPRGSDQPSPALTPSLFPGCLPPTIHFPMPDENCEWYLSLHVCITM